MLDQHDLGMALKECQPAAADEAIRFLYLAFPLRPTA